MISQNTFEKALDLISAQIIRTPIVYSPSMSRQFDCQVFLKLENLQVTGSFKIRGAMVKLLSKSTIISKKGVVTASAGNHAQGVALAARQAKLPATIVMPGWASITKQEATRNYGGNVVIHGNSIGESLEKAHEIEKKGHTFIHPFNDPDIIAGQGTIGLEIHQDLKDVDLIVAPIGGGGLISGLSCLSKQIRPETKIIGVQAAACPSAFESFNKGKVLRVEATPSIADGISVKETGDLTLKFISAYVDEVVLVDEEHIAAAMLMLLERKKLLAEGAGAVPLAALIGGKISHIRGKKIVLVISGGNVDSPLVGRIINRGLNKSGRVIRITVVLPDSPGSISKLLAKIAQMNANVLHIHHDRNALDIPINKSRVTLELETRGTNHSEDIIRTLEEKGFNIKQTISSGTHQ
ncbi:MAG: threonine ammonia-lyase [Proteobacteria bacterium]|nr:threonine ammonia-lyase [Pseudomonadota bacterium]